MQSSSGSKSIGPATGHIPRADQQTVIAVIAVEVIQHGIVLPRRGPEQKIRAGAAEQRVLSRPAAERIVAFAPVQRIVAATAQQAVAVEPALQRIGALAPVQRATAIMGEKQVIAIKPPHQIGAGIAMQRVIAIAAQHGIGPGTAHQFVIRAQPVQQVIAARAAQLVGLRRAGQGIVAFGADGDHPAGRGLIAVVQHQRVALCLWRVIVGQIIPLLVVFGRGVGKADDRKRSQHHHAHHSRQPDHDPNPAQTLPDIVPQPTSPGNANRGAGLTAGRR